MTEATERRWGILPQRPLFMGQIEDYLPPSHKVIAERTADGHHEYIIEGGDMPLVHEDQEPQRVEILFATLAGGAAYCYWGHNLKQWLLPPGLWPCATD